MTNGSCIPLVINTNVHLTSAVVFVMHILL